MTQTMKALCWACALILLALGSALDLVERETAQTLFVVLPAVAWMSLNGRASACRITAGRQA